MISIPGLSVQDCNDIETVFRSQSWVRRVWLFGSRAKGSAKPGSDVDLALDGAQGDLTKLSELRYLLNEESCLPYRFDLIDRASIHSPELAEHLERVGLLLYDQSDVS